MAWVDLLPKSAGSGGGAGHLNMPEILDAIVAPGGGEPVPRDSSCIIFGRVFLEASVSGQYGYPIPC
jgi:hypothetical protein